MSAQLLHISEQLPQWHRHDLISRFRNVRKSVQSLWGYSLNFAHIDTPTPRIWKFLAGKAVERFVSSSLSHLACNVTQCFFQNQLDMYILNIWSRTHPFFEWWAIHCNYKPQWRLLSGHHRLLWEDENNTLFAIHDDLWYIKAKQFSKRILQKGRERRKGIFPTCVRAVNAPYFRRILRSRIWSYEGWSNSIAGGFYARGGMQSTVDGFA